MDKLIIVSDGKTGNTTVNCGDSTTLYITPNTGYHTVDVKIYGESIAIRDSYTFEKVRENHTIEVEFSPVGS